MGGQWAAQNPQKSFQILRSPLQGASRWRPGGDFLPKEVTFTKHQYLQWFRHILPPQGAPLPTPLDPKAVQRPSKEALKKDIKT